MLPPSVSKFSKGSLRTRAFCVQYWGELCQS